MDAKQIAAQVIGCGVENVEQEKYDHYGLQVFTYRDSEVAIGTDTQATEAAKK